MQKEIVLQTVISINLHKGQIGNDCDSALSEVENCIRTAAAQPTEKEKKERLIGIMQGFWRGESKQINGCRREQLQQIARLAFGIGSQQSSQLRKEIRSFTFQELYLYYCYAEWMAKGDEYFTKYLLSCQKERKKKLIARKEKEQVLDEERRRVDELSGKEKWKNEIFEKQKDMVYYRQLDGEGLLDAQDRKTVALLLMEYWNKIGKWEGRKVSQKQLVKIAKVKEILQETNG